MTEQAPTTTPPPAPAAPEAKVETKPAEANPNSAKLLELARREAELAKREVARKAELQKMQEELKTYQEKVKLLDEVKTAYKKDPIGVLSKLGMTYEELTEAVIDAGNTKKKPEEPVDVKSEVERLLKERELEALQQQMEEAAAGFVEDIGSFIKDNGSKYPLMTQLYETIGGMESPEQLIYTAIDEHFNETGEILEFDKVASAIETHFAEEWTNLNKKVTGGNATPAETAKAEAVAETVKTTSNGKEGDDSFSGLKPITGFGKGSLSANDFQQNDRTPFTLTNRMPQKKPFDAKAEVRKSAEQRALEVLEKWEKEGKK